MKGKRAIDSNSPKKGRFAPRVPVRKRPVPATAAKGNESVTKEDIVIDKELLAKINRTQLVDSSTGRVADDKKSSQLQVAFGPGSSSSIRTFGNPKTPVNSEHDDVYKRSAAAQIKIVEPQDDNQGYYPATFPHASSDDSDTTEEYVEPWDYDHCYYPTTFPLRRPHSGDPEILNMEEFDEGQVITEVPPEDEEFGEELGLVERSTEPKVFVFQLPATLPFYKGPLPSGEAKETASVVNTGSSSRPDTATDLGKRSNSGKETDEKQRKGCTLKDLPTGFLGKMLVHKSGKVKLKMGNVVLDVSPGQDCNFAQDLAVFDLKEKKCCVLGNVVRKRAVVSPDM